MYGRTVPFYTTGIEYVDYELNIEDVRFLVWYSVAMLSEEHRYLYPLDKQLMEMADGAFSLLESVYDEAPLPEDWRLTLGLDLKDPDDKERIYIVSVTGSSLAVIFLLPHSLDLMEIVSDPDMAKRERHGVSSAPA